ncbi:MAG: WYL domain-containing protein [Nitriliruptoraceae bacterium]|nr:WYL domain-containing protein [Nitriliruptoraceae bacterium]
MTAKVERLVNLTVALLETRRPLTLRELKQRTGYYDQADGAAARRMFERDKDELRRLGVPVTVAPVPHSEEQGYLVPRREYELADIELTGEEVAALGLAVRLTGAEGTPLALAKLAARAPDPVALPEPTTRVELSVDAVDAIADAVVRRRSVRFGYRRADGTDGRRAVDPFAVVRRRAAWYVVGRDHDRDALRAFRLDRMTDEPRAFGDDDAFTVPDDLDVERAVAGPEEEGVPVLLAVAPAARWAVELRGGARTGRTHADWPVYELPGLHPWRDRSWILGLGPDVVVLDPPRLRDAVVAALDAVLAPGADAPGSEPT